MRRVTTFVLSAMLTLGGGLPLTASQAEPPASVPTAMAVSPPISMPTPAPSPEPESATDNRLFAVGAGAIVGVVAFNMLTYPLGSVPFVAGALAGTPVDIALGSRLLAAMVSGVSALAAHYLYLFYTDADTEDAPAAR